MKRADRPQYYPVGLNITGKECLVLGGGKVAERKIKRLLNYGAKVRVVSPSLTPLLQAWADKRLLKYCQGRFSSALLKKQALVFATTNDTELNQRIVRLASRKRILANAAKPGRVSGFIVPALLKRRSFTVAISTEGRSPKTAKRIRKKLEKIL